ncbi:MAG TPA: amino acid racemase [Rhodothermales bacterium]|nr:amino acid racemase [Rhodothermales bacterium]
MSYSKTIGLVGGMGPFTGVDALNKILAETIGDKDQDHLPVVLASFPDRIPDRGSFVLGKSTENPARAIFDIIEWLDEQGVSVAGIPCVTAHCEPIFSVVRSLLDESGRSIRLLNLIDVTLEYVREVNPGLRCIGALSTTASYRSRVFLDALVKAGFEPIEQDQGVQDDLVNPAIFDPQFGIKALANPVTAKARDLVFKAIAHLGERGAQAVILGCTELPLAVTEATLNGILCIDPTRALARALIREAAPENLRTGRTSDLAPRTFSSHEN